MESEKNAPRGENPVDGTRVREMLSHYDTDKLSIAVLGSHSALEICAGAKKAGFKSIVVCQKGRERTYAEYFKSNGTSGVVDEVILVDRFKDILSAPVQEKLRAQNAVFVPHRSFQVYTEFDYDAIENDFEVPMLGSRNLLRTEERTAEKGQYYLLEKAGIRYPKAFPRPEDIDRLAVVKAGEAARAFERKFFLVRNADDYREKSARLIAKGETTRESVQNALIEEYVMGVHCNFNYFYSPVQKRVELMGTDTRRQTNLDGLIRVTANEQERALEYLTPTYEEAGHIACTVLESMLELILDAGERFARATQDEFAPGLIGPFALQSMIVPGPPKKDIVVFDVSPRFPGSPGTKFTPYAEYLYGKQYSVGERLARELCDARDRDKLEKVLT